MDIKVIIFDKDGVIVDSEMIHYRAHKLALKSNEIDLSIQDYKDKGMSRDVRVFYAEMLALDSNSKVINL
ncbi:MAG: hypothetical protein Q9M91_01870 [Candidatus Dojkabacteria bacterium]|nr:hypothetical protein [Candidatus Dojkabacteria bacterium]MDQ7020571.1 hypothetical protein [Candidatus Dojkabacteria bacterium]